jgi:gamma-glutamyl:cysteine ligase YbdK (ATP-grasp superfamily)
VSLRDSLLTLFGALAEDAEALGCLDWLQVLATVAQAGSGDAEWLRGRAKTHGNLHDAVRDASERFMEKAA